MKLSKEKKEQRLQNAIEDEDILVINNKRYLNLERESEENLEHYRKLAFGTLVYTRLGAFEKTHTPQHQQKFEVASRNEIIPNLRSISSYHNNYSLQYYEDESECE